MRSHTSLALGFLVLAASACGSEDEGSPASPPPPFAGGVPGLPGATPDNSTQPDPAAPATDGDSPTNGPDSAGQAPGGAAGGEAPMGDSQLDPSAPTEGENGGQMQNEDPTDEENPAMEDPAVEEEPTPGEEEPPVVEEEPPGPQTQVYILFGQSNMWGVAIPEAQDLAVTARAEVLTLTACGQHGANEWVPARPPLHSCVGQPGGGQGPGLGPGDYFAKEMTAAFPEDTILLVPNAVPGVSIDVFQPGQQNYTSMLNRARMAQERGEIRGILFHQGETDANQQNWPNRVQTVVNQLRSDLGIGDVPFLAGELMYGNAGLAQHNQLVAQLPNTISNAFVVSAQGFTDVPAALDTFGNLHFDVTSQREFGRRYAQVMLGALGN